MGELPDLHKIWTDFGRPSHFLNLSYLNRLAYARIEPVFLSVASESRAWCSCPLSGSQPLGGLNG
jgi:hypothetical protein